MSQTVKDVNSLLNVLRCISIDIGSFNTNVLKAWFDTHDEDIIHFLNFICRSLSRHNVLMPEELEEYKAVSYDVNENASLKIQNIGEDYSGIFENNSNSEQLDIFLGELRQLNSEEEKLDELLNTAEQVQNILLQEHTNLRSIAVTLGFKCDQMRREFEYSSEILDTINENICERMKSVLFQLSNLFFDESHLTVNHKSIEKFQDSIEFDNNIHEIVRKKHNDLSINFSQSKINLNSTPNDENLRGNLEKYEKEIYQSYVSCLAIKFEEASLLEGLFFFENFSRENYLSQNKNFTFDTSFCKTDQREIFLELLKNNIELLTEEPFNVLKKERTQKKWECLNDDINCYNQISKYYSKDLCLLLYAFFLLLQKLSHVENSVALGRHISQYIFNILEIIRCRSESMDTVVCRFSEYINMPILCKLETISFLANIYPENTLNELYKSYDLIRENMKTLENVYFRQIFSELVYIVKIHSNIDKVKEFLYSGPTERSLVIPQKIEKTLRSVRCDISKQMSAIKILIQVNNYFSKKLNLDNLSFNLRLVWIYFLISHDKLKSILNQFNENMKNQNL